MNPNDQSGELPRYQCHKIVWALKIKQIELREPLDDNEAGQEVWIVPGDEGYKPFRVEWSWFNKHKPEAGWYWVKYAQDGYESASPPEAFEEGYTRV